MARPQKIPPQQLDRVRRLESILSAATVSGELRKAKIALDDLRIILEKYKHSHRVLEAYLMLYETALEAWDLDLAKRGFEFVRREAHKRTRLYLEATVLLALAHLRNQDLFSAEPLMAEALRNDDVITSKSQRIAFRREAIERFDQDGALAAMAKLHPEVMHEARVHQGALDLLRKGMNEQDIEENLGSRIPQEVKEFILKVDVLSKKLIPHETRLLLPAPTDVIKNRRVAHLVFNAAKRRLYGMICDENSETYQSWISGGLDAICSKGYVASVVVSVLTNIKVAIPAVAVGISALLMKQGITNFCSSSKPNRFMDLRRKKADKEGWQ